MEWSNNVSITLNEYRMLVQRDLSIFVHRAFIELSPHTPFFPNWHIDMMCEALERVAQREITRLIINLPPRNLKSHTISVAFPAWYLGHHPSRQVICASYGQDLASKFARDTRTLMDSEFYRSMFSTRISNRKAVDDFETTEHGIRMATSVGGVVTGRGADLIIIDDPLKPDEALSGPRRKAVNEWYDNTLLSRLNDKAKGAIILVQQRLHQDDLVGHVLEQSDWHVLNFPAIAEHDETHIITSILGSRIVTRRQGEALHPERESLETLTSIRRSMGEYNFSSQYQQNPISKDGAMVKRSWLQFYSKDQLPKFITIVQSWDTANKTSELNDFSVCTTWGVKDQKFYLLDVYRKRLDFPELRRAVIDQKQRHKASTIVIEDRASGTQLIQDLRSSGIFAKAYAPPSGTDKVMRLHSQTVLFENGQVLLPRDAPWLNDYINELIGFPGAKFDDQVDSTTQALEFMRGPAMILDTWIRAGRP